MRRSYQRMVDNTGATSQLISTISSFNLRPKFFPPRIESALICVTRNSSLDFNSTDCAPSRDFRYYIAAYNAASAPKPSLPEDTGSSYPIMVCCRYATWTCSFQQKTKEYVGGRNRGMHRVQRRYRADDLKSFLALNRTTIVQLFKWYSNGPL